jgi:hypothetical protein
MHACRSNMVPRSLVAKTIGPLAVFDWRIERHIRHSGAGDFLRDQNAGPIKGSLDQGAKTSAHPDPIHPEPVPLF